MISAFRFAACPSQKILEGVRLGFLRFNCVGFLIYPIELTILGHWSQTFGSTIPYLASVPDFIVTVLFLNNRKNPIVYRSFVVVMIVIALTSFLGLGFHLVHNFDSQVGLGFISTAKALEGAAPTMAALAFTHIGLTGLICCYRAR